MTSHREAHKIHAFTKFATHAYIKSVAPLQEDRMLKEGIIFSCTNCTLPEYKEAIDKLLAHSAIQAL